MAERKLFGTDGVRGIAGEVLTASLALQLGRAAVAELGARRLLILRDTRRSGPMLEAALAAGAASSGASVLSGGVLPTPAAPLLAGRLGFDLAAVISASHNPFADNGIKFFGPDGFKLSDETEARIEARIAADDGIGSEHGDIGRLIGAHEDYLRVLEERFAGLDLTGVRVALDCANGATFHVAPQIFRRLGATVTATHVEPDGENINAGCGSTHLESLQELMREGAHDVGFAFDGDGDRVLAVDRNGGVVDGDELIALAARHLARLGQLGGGVAVTVMTNFGFHRAMAERDIEVAITGVGDRYVLEALRERQWRLGGEQSGHIIDLGFCSSGDGIASALLTLEALAGHDLVERDGMTKMPQLLLNVPVPDREAALLDAEVLAARDAAALELGDQGRILLRASGTEQLVRVMVEAPTEDLATALCERVAEQVRALSPVA
ncbi:MAG: phosphoglucosamine mutase [Solirubrobacteraceae bacterium]|nr:phosphoglucosamine mutase [Solirubrobacteraceae bacterium]